jgi:hypothetical protein
MKRSRLSRNEKVREKRRLRMVTKVEPFDKVMLTEKEVLLIKNRLNHGKYNVTTVLQASPDGGWKLTDEQTKKGLKWLMSQWKTPRGVEQKNNPFGYREQDILENFGEFRLIDFFDNRNYYQAQLGVHNYLPLYEVIRKDGKVSFQYYADWKGIHIVG